MSTPLLELDAGSVTNIQFPRDWCDKPRDVSGCLCDYQHDVIITDISDAEEVINSINETLAATEGDLGRVVDWWTEGVVLPFICSIGILGEYCGWMISYVLHVFGSRQHHLYLCLA